MVRGLRVSSARRLSLAGSRLFVRLAASGPGQPRSLVGAPTGAHAAACPLSPRDPPRLPPALVTQPRLRRGVHCPQSCVKSPCVACNESGLPPAIAASSGQQCHSACCGRGSAAPRGPRRPAPLRRGGGGEVGAEPVGGA